VRGLIYIGRDGRVHWCTVDRDKLLPASVVCLCLFLAGLVLLFGCSALAASPQGRKAPVTRSVFETMQAQAAEIGALNGKYIDGMLAAQRAGDFSVAQANKLLTPSIAISQADSEVYSTLTGIVEHSAGKTPEIRDELAEGLAKIQTAATIGLPRQLATIIRSVGDARKTLPAVKNRVQRQALDEKLLRIGRLAADITAELKREGVIK